MEILETISKILYTFIPGALIFFCLSVGIYLFSKDKIYRYPSNEWLDVKKVPIPEGIKEYIATDGKRVSHMYSVDWGPHGQIIFCKYDKTYTTHWMPYPDVPQK